jgi:hypothetical protein
MKNILLNTLVSIALATSAIASASNNPADEITSQANYNKQITDIVFYYTPDALAYYNGDMEKLQTFIESSVNNNNTAFDGGSIPITRRIAAILPASELPKNDWISSDLQDINDFKSVYNDIRKSLIDTFDDTLESYKASHFAIIASKKSFNNTGTVGYAIIGGNVALLLTQNTQDSYLLAHELGHNDGLDHGFDEKNPLLSDYAIGADCGGSSTIMNYGTQIGQFSNPEIEHNDEACGESGIADVAASYKDAMSTTFANREAPFFYNKTIRERTGNATLSLPSSNVTEGEDITVEIHWNNAPDKASIDLYTQAVALGASVDDYTQTMLRVHYTGEAVTIVNIATTNDDLYELDELVNVGIRYGSGVSTQNNVEPVVISSDDAGQSGAFDFNVTALTITEGSSKEIIINRTGGSDGDVSISLYTESGTAETVDFTTINKTILFLDGETSKTISIETVNDNANEGNESFTLSIEADATLLGNNTVATVTIDDSADVPAVITPPTTKSSSGGGSSSIFVLLSLMGILFTRRK